MLVKKERFIASTINPNQKVINPIQDSINPTINPNQKVINPIQDSINPTINPNQKVINPIQDSINPTINPKTLESTDSQKDTAIEDGKVRTVYVKGNIDLKRDLELELKRYLEVKLKGNFEVDVNLDVDLELDGNRNVKLSKENNTMDNTLNQELIKNLIISINHNTKVNSEDNNKLIESINRNFKELTTSILLLKDCIKNSNETCKKEIETLQDKVNKLQESHNKEVTVTTNGKETNHSSSTSIEDKILSHQLDVVSDNPIKDNAWKQEQQKKALQEARQEQSQKIDTKTTVQENNSNEGETNYVLKKLDNLKNGWIEKINTVTTEEQLFEYSDSSLHQFSDFAKIHVGFQRESDKTFKELQPLFEAKYNQFQSNKETTPKTENCEEKKETTTEPNTANSKNVEVPKTDTPNDKEKTQEEIDKEFENETSSMFLTDTKQTVSTKKSEEVKFPETKVIPLREGEEKRQLQELVDNQTLNVLLEGYCATDNKKYKEILTEIRKVITKGNYPKRVVQAYLREIESKGYYCNTQDAMKPLEDTKEEKETTAETTSTPKGDSLEKFKESLDNIEKNVEENGNQLPFGNNPKSNHQDVDESNCYQSEEEKMAMACSCSYFNTKT